MTEPIIANSLKTVLDAALLTISGVAADTYVWIKSHARNLNLNNPNLWNNTTNKVILVIHPSSIPTTLRQTTGSRLQSYQGVIKVYAKTAANMETILPLIAAVANGNNYINFYIPDYDGNPVESDFWCQVFYRYNKTIVY